MMTRVDVRTQLERLLVEQLLGPREEQEVLDATPSDVYLTGILWPRDTEIANQEDDAASAELAGDDADAMDSASPGYRAIRPCTIGLTFEVQAGASAMISLGSTARYEATEVTSETAEGGEGADQHYAWHRRQLDYRTPVAANEKRSRWRVREFVLPDGSTKADSDIAVDIVRRVVSDRAVLTITLINMSTGDVPRRLRDTQLLFQAQLLVEAESAKGTPAIQPRDLYPFADDEDQLSNLLLYRDVREFAVGHGIAAEWPGSPPRGEKAVGQVRTSWIPRARVLNTTTDGHPLMKELRGRDPSPFAAHTLARQTRREETCSELSALCSLYGQWIDSHLTNRIRDFDGLLLQAATHNRSHCESAQQRMQDGVSSLRNSDTAWEAFVLANQAIDMQAQFPSKEAPKPLVWRPFQLAFFLMVLPGLVNAKDSSRETMDLLWFPTGGGKTESYLAIAAFEIFRRRLVSQHRRSMGGVDVLMRYTLRLLTIQQFQRAASLIAACEMIRTRDQERLGLAPISLGLYVGRDSTPNQLEDAAQKLLDEQNGQRPDSTPRQILSCPVCGSELGTAAYRIDLRSSSMSLRCAKSGCQTAGNPIPVMTVDEAIYAHPPSLLIGTADKLAQLPRNERIGDLFGCRLSERLGLIIQDELHLISGPLGSMAGLYEAAIDYLCTIDGIRPKIIGSTATIGRAGRQVRALFDRAVLQFPPAGFDSSDSFFAVRDDVGADRVYYGVASAGRSPKFALQALLAVLMQSPHAIRESAIATDSDIDPYWTCVAYFNSLRELGAAHVLMLDDVRRQIAFLAGRMGRTARQMDEPPRELSGRRASREIPDELRKLSQSLGSGDPFAPQPADAVLASNMISVGVDIPRLGLMAVAGQPKSTAEYIQATSRVGRGLPGLIVTLYNFGRPRDLSHFEHFVGYHAALYRGVEATSVTPWAARARDKALHAIFAATVRHIVNGMLGDEDAIAFDPKNAVVRAIVEYLTKRAGSATNGLESGPTRNQIIELENVWHAKAAESAALGKKLRYWQRHAPFGRTAPHLMRSAEEMRGADGKAWPTPNSLRDVEPSTAFVLRRFPTRDAPNG